MTNPVQYLHLRAITGRTENNQAIFDRSVRGITVVAEFLDDGLVAFAWALQSKKDMYSKKVGREMALSRLRNEDEDNIVFVTNYLPHLPLKYQFFNAVAGVVKDKEFLKELQPRSDARFVEMTFQALAKISAINHWFCELPSELLERIHPEAIHCHIECRRKRTYANYLQGKGIGLVPAGLLHRTAYL